MCRYALIVALIIPGFLPAGARAAAGAAGRYEVRAIRDVAYYQGKDADPVKHRLDLYLPCKECFPVLFFVHGGTWRSGDKRIYPKLGEVFAGRGVGTVIINYRLSPGVRHPAHIRDVARAFAWTVRNIGKYGGRADCVFLSGHSAGGHLAALLATDETYLRAEKLSLGSIRGVLTLSGVYVIVPGAWQKAFGSDVDVCWHASPLHWVSDRCPPFLLLYADRDFPTLGWMAEGMAAALRRSKREATSIQVKGRNHISLMLRMADAGDPTTQAMLAFIARHAKR
jgi:acetyl esterase/lipase